MRRYYSVSVKEVTGAYTWKKEEVLTRVNTVEEATLVSSEMDENTEIHLPVLDIDFPCELLDSSTDGHHHLYLNRPMEWRKYKRLLRALWKAGIIEDGYYKLAKKRKKTCVRAPDVLKEESERTPDDVAEATRKLLSLEGSLVHEGVKPIDKPLMIPTPEQKEASIQASPTSKGYHKSAGTYGGGSWRNSDPYY